MTAAFGISFHDALKYDIRHMHSGRQPSDCHRKPVYHSGINIQDRIREQQTRYRYEIGHYPRRNLVYLSRYNICIPKAPAFNVFDRKEIEEIVNRLNDPVSHGQRYKITDSGPGSTAGSKASSASSQRIKARQKGKEAEQNGQKGGVNVNELVDRLHRQGQTHSSTTRRKETVKNCTPLCKFLA